MTITGDEAIKIGMELRANIGGNAFSTDRLWRITTPDFVAGVCEYNGEVTGATKELREEVFYSANMHYWHLVFERRGWQVEQIEDRLP